jgi:hypothetical protein
MSTQHTFWSLMDSYQVEIPIIQRDYAQGRTDKKATQIRQSFVSTLAEMVSDTKKTQDLDFIYGTVNEGTLVLLDGQQRLTTLFLLHWYLAARAGNLNAASSRLKKFTYKTCVSSRNFCQALSVHTLSEEAFINTTAISSEIRDATWFFSVWRVDPTVQSMLVMLDEIHHVFSTYDAKTLWAQLCCQQSPPVTFHFLNLDKFGLTDELYIKMNARGKALSDFENLKAGLLAYIEKQDGFRLPENFWTLLDKDWTDIFWNYCSAQKVYEVDAPMMKLFKLVALYGYVETLKIPAKRFDLSVETKINHLRLDEYVSMPDILSIETFNENFFQQVYQFLHFFACQHMRFIGSNCLMH